MTKILIIEDDPAIILGLEELLRQEHFDVLTSNDGLLGYQKALKEKINLIILDLVKAELWFNSFSQKIFTFGFPLFCQW